jgi:hypothetical protein
MHERGSRGKLSYANVMATLAVFIALGGSSYAVSSIDGSNIADRSIPGDKLKRNTLGKAEIDEGNLGRVPKAKLADNSRALQGRPAKAFLGSKVIVRSDTTADVPFTDFVVGTVVCEAGEQLISGSVDDIPLGASVTDDAPVPPEGHSLADGLPPIGWHGVLRVPSSDQATVHGLCTKIGGVKP